MQWAEITSTYAFPFSRKENTLACRVWENVKVHPPRARRATRTGDKNNNFSLSTIETLVFWFGKIRKALFFAMTT